jgi:hypothetical protein
MPVEALSGPEVAGFGLVPQQKYWTKLQLI